jgi:uncharacterized protein YraI
MLVFSIMFVSSPSTAEQPMIGVVTTQDDALNIRNGPGTQYAVVGKAGPGETLWIKKNVGDWYHVQLQDGTVGYASSRYIRIDEDGRNTDPRFLLAKHKAGLAEIGMTVDSLYSHYNAEFIHLVDLHLEGMFTPALEVFVPGAPGKAPVFVAEIGCSDSWILERITVYDPQFRLTTGIGVGSTLGELKRVYTVEWIKWGEGALYARVAELAMSFQLDVKGISQGTDITKSPHLLPVDVKILSILIN